MWCYMPGVIVWLTDLDTLNMLLDREVPGYKYELALQQEHI